MTKAVCAKHDQAYDVGEGCKWCDAPGEAPDLVAMTDIVIEWNRIKQEHTDLQLSNHHTHGGHVESLLVRCSCGATSSVRPAFDWFRCPRCRYSWRRVLGRIQPT